MFFTHTQTKKTPCLGTCSDAALSNIPQAVSSSQAPGDLFSKFLLEKECKTEFSGYFKSQNDGRETILTSRSQAGQYGELYLQVRTRQPRVHTGGVGRSWCQEEAALRRGRAGAKSHSADWCAAWKQRKVTRTTGKAPAAGERQCEQLGLLEREPLVLGMTLLE